MPEQQREDARPEEGPEEAELTCKILAGEYELFAIHAAKANEERFQLTLAQIAAHAGLQQP